MRQFDGRAAGTLAFLECTLITDLSGSEEDIAPYRQVDVRLPNNKVLRLPYSWLREVTPEDLDEFLDVDENPEQEWAEGEEGYLADAAAADEPPKKVTVPRAPRK